MHPTLQLAFTTADEIITSITKDSTITSERERLKTLSKEELIEELLILKCKKSKDIKVEDLVYAVMKAPDCAALSYAMIASIILKHRPGKTNESNIRWYASKAIEKGQDTVPRMIQKELNKLILASAA